MFKNKVVSTILKYNLIDKNDKILIALSGGADSVCLFYILYELKEMYNLTIECAHVNHMLRGAEADRDQQFAEGLCKAFGIKIHILKRNVLEFAEKNGLSSEEAGRIIRYGFFDSIIKSEWKIATAHTKDDNAENMLINLIRGNIPNGIKSKRKNIIRPLIETRKSEIIKYLNNREYKTDSSNLSEEFLRNKVRISLIPLIKEKFNQNFTNTVYNISDILFCENDYFEELTDDFIKENVIVSDNHIEVSIEKLKKLHLSLKRRIIKRLYLMMNQRNPELSYISYISYINIDDTVKLFEKGNTGKKIKLPDSVIAEISYEKLVFYKNEPDIPEYYYKLSLGDTLSIKEINMKFTLSESELDIPYKYLYKINSESIIVRNKINGDRVEIKNGHKNVSDLFTDKKIPRFVRVKTPVISDNDNIILIPEIYEKKLSSGDKFLYIGEIK